MRRIAAASLLLALAAPASAQQDFSKVEVKVERLAPGVAVLFGAGGNIGLSHGEDGNVLIDDQFAPLVPKIEAAVRSIDPDPIRFVINTHWHGDHTGGNEALGKAGAVIVAHDNVRQRMSMDRFSKRFNTTIRATPKSGLPVVTFTQGVSFHLNGDRIQVIHVNDAHTDGDALVYWTGANVLHMGDTFFNKVTYPFIDRESGGTIDGLIRAAKRGLSLVRPGGKIIPGHGPVASREDLQAYHDMLLDIRTKVVAGIRAGRTKSAVIASHPTAAHSAVATDGFIKPDDFVAGIYDELKQGSAGARR